MHLFPTPPALAERPTATSAAETRLHGRRLLLARLLWIGVTLVTVALFVISVLLALDLWQRICTGTPCLSVQLTAADARFLQAHGVSISTWATFWVVENVLVTLGWMGMGAFIFWRRSDDWLALLAAGYLVTFRAGFSRSLESLALVVPGWSWPVIIAQVLGNVTIIGFICLFPTGRFAPRWTLLVAAVLVLNFVVLPYTPLDPWYLPRAYRNLSHRQATHLPLHRRRRFAPSGGSSRVACSWRMKDEELRLSETSPLRDHHDLLEMRRDTYAFQHHPRPVAPA